MFVCFVFFFAHQIYKKYGVTCCGGMTRSESGTALNTITLRSLEDLKSNIDATFPQR